MKQTQWKTYAFWILWAELTGILSGWLTRAETALYSISVIQPPLSPPALLFPIVWSILYGLMGVSGARVYLSSASNIRSRGLLLYVLQLTFNFFWSIFFFNLRQFGFAFLWLLVLWGLILLMLLSFRQTDRLAAWLQLPYLLWVSFAAYLNFGVWMLNP